jgi:hypothetical protein
MVEIALLGKELGQVRNVLARVSCQPNHLQVLI